MESSASCFGSFVGGGLDGFGRTIEPGEARFRRPVLQQCRPHERGIRSRRRFGNEALVHQRYRDLVPVDRLRRKHAQEGGRRGAAGDGKKARPLALDGARQPACDVVRQRFGKFAARTEAVPDGVDRGGRHALSCHVRPSRSISAIEADGPHVPAV